MMILLAIFGVACLCFVLVEGYRWWLGGRVEYESKPLAGDDDQDIDFGAALRSIGGSR
jgi:hypothetical protein